MVMALPFLLFFAVAGLDWCIARLQAPAWMKMSVWPVLALLLITLNLGSIQPAVRSRYPNSTSSIPGRLYLVSQPPFSQKNSPAHGATSAQNVDARGLPVWRVKRICRNAHAAGSGRVNRCRRTGQPCSEDATSRTT